MKLKELESELREDPQYAKYSKAYDKLEEKMWKQFQKNRKLMGDKDAFCDCLSDFSIQLPNYEK